MTKRLGKGLGSLLGDRGLPDSNPRSEVDLARIRPNPFQPRKVFDPEALEELRDSIQRHGILQPVVVRRASDGFELVSGERRWRAAKLAGLQRIPVVIRDEISDDQMLELALVENLQRQDLDPIERARGFQAMIDQLELSQQDVAQRVGLNRATVANHLRLLELPDAVQEAIGKGLITMGHARALLGLPTRGAILSTLDRVVRKDLSVREVERLVRRHAAEATGPKARASLPWAEEIQRRVQERLGTKVSFFGRNAKRGRIVIEYYTRSDLDRICDLLAPREEL